MNSKREYSGSRLIARLTPNDELCLRNLFSHTAARTKSEVVRFAVTLLADLWEYQLLGAKLELHTSEEGNCCRTLLLGSAVDRYSDDTTNLKQNLSLNKLSYTLQLRLTPEDAKQLSWLIENGAGDNRSSIVRSAINLYHEIVESFLNGYYLWVKLPGGDSMPVELLGMPRLQPGKIGLTHRIEEAEPPRNLDSLPPGTQITLEEFKRLHSEYNWESILIKVANLYDEREFMPIVEKHIRYGTKLFYLHYDRFVLNELSKHLRHRDQNLAGHIREFLRLLLIDAEVFKNYDEFVFFNFLEDSSREKKGVIWHPDISKGVIADRESLEGITRTFRGYAEELEEQFREAEEALCANIKPFEPIVKPLYRDRKGRT